MNNAGIENIAKSLKTKQYFYICTLIKNQKLSKMRKLMNYKALVAVMVIALAMGACKKSSDDATPEPVASMSAKINETAGDSASYNVTTSANWDAITRVSVVKNDVLLITGTQINLAALSNPDIIAITVYGPRVGTFTMGLGTLSLQCGCVLTTTYGIKYPSVFASTTGSVTISNFDTTAKLISGTFEFTVYSGVTKTISEGKFENLKYTVQ